MGVGYYVQPRGTEKYFFFGWGEVHKIERAAFKFAELSTVLNPCNGGLHRASVSNTSNLEMAQMWVSVQSVLYASTVPLL